jgi:hypothetical protein
VAVLAWEKDKRRAYQFEDGKLRKFKKGYYSLLEPAKKVERPRETVVSSLQNAVRAKEGASDRKSLTPVCSFRDQVRLFERLFPEGFRSSSWIEEHRGGDGGRRLKRHRDPAIEEAREALGRGECNDLLEEGRHKDLSRAVYGILAGTSLVPLSAAKVLKEMKGDESQELAVAVSTLLHGEGDFDVRFGEYLRVLGKVYGHQPSWRVATALPALIYPEKQVCVRRSVFLRQAASISPDALYSKRVRVRAYKNFRRVAFAVRKRLQAEGHEPRDLLDIHDFSWLTLRNAALEHLK